MVAILDHMSALADPTRCRILLLLEKHELTVSELCAVLQTAAVERQSSPENAGGRRLGGVAARRHEPLLQHAAR